MPPKTPEMIGKNTPALFPIEFTSFAAPPIIELPPPLSGANSSEIARACVTIPNADSIIAIACAVGSCCGFAGRFSEQSDRAERRDGRTRFSQFQYRRRLQ